MGVERVVQHLDVEPGRRTDRVGLHRVTRKGPQLVLQRLDLVDPLAILRSVGHDAGDRDSRVGVLLEQRQRLAPLGFVEQLCAQVGGTDVVGLLHHERPPPLVPAHRHRQAEREQQADEAE